MDAVEKGIKELREERDCYRRALEEIAGGRLPPDVAYANALADGPVGNWYINIARQALKGESA